MRYETPQDLANELAVMDAFCNRYNMVAKKLPWKHACDFAVFTKGGHLKNGSLTCFAEVRCRSIALKDCKQFQIAYMKYVTGRKLADYAGVPFIFVIRFTDTLAWVRPSASADTVVWGGHNHRDDINDQETMLVINPKEFTKFK